MSDDKGKAPVNVVKPTSNELLASQNTSDNTGSATGDQSAASSTPKTSLLMPDAPAELIAALSMGTEVFDPLAEPFGTINQYGETILFESKMERVSTSPDVNKIRVSTKGMAKVSIIFYPELGKIQWIVQGSDTKFLPASKKEFSEDKIVKYNGWGIAFAKGNWYATEWRSDSSHGYLFGPYDGLNLKISTLEKLMELKSLIQSIQVRITKKRLPTKIISEDSHSRLELEFWFHSALRPSDAKILLILEGNIWTIQENSEAQCSHGTLALVQCKKTKTLQMVTCFNGIASSFRVHEYFVVFASTISLNKNDYIWEWFSNKNDRQACDFKTAKEAHDFRTVVYFYVKAFNDRKLSWDW